MQDPGKEYWETEDYSTSYNSDEKLGSMWRKGLNMGKKMVMIGVVITSAPLILPSFFALSTLGFAFSLPAGFAYVTYVCTEKLVNLLLPMPSQFSLLEKSTTSTDEDVDWVNSNDGYKRYREEMEADEDKFGEDGRKGIGTRTELEENNETDMGEKVNEFVEESVHDEQILSSNVIPDILEGIKEEEDEMCLMKEHDEFPVDSVQAVIVAADVGGDSEDNVDLVLEQMSVLAPSHSKEGNTSKGRSSDKSEEKRKETTGLIGEMRDEGKHDQKTLDRGAQQTAKGSKGASVSDTSESKVNTNVFVSSEEVKPAQVSREVVNGSKSGGKSNDASIVGTKQKVGKKKPRRDKRTLMQEEQKPLVAERIEVSVDEEKRWVQLNAIRRIVGYKAAPNSSCVEELEALYMFTGVELPTSSRAATDLVNIDERLQFLMSIIGVQQQSSK